ncbi:MAG: BlaI/MecI/CopY family transcriptional regulator [Bacteroidales bacterium]|nr:BlaI/MecI/CopY family transcriptional regulator [Bacteroidales bacterium]
MKELTKAEEQVMQYLWKIEKGFLKDIIDQFPQPRPAPTTVATFIKSLVTKGFIGYNTYGKINEYYPKIQQNEYAKRSLKTIVKNFFGNSVNHFSSFFAKDNNLSLAELEHLKKIIDEQIEQKKSEK